jgi:NAD(P)-dependent dehydrogenase (short-subunit alcohol dehydrogenase family)
MNPKGHAALVTGGASGLGEGTAIKLAEAGCKVTVLDMNMDLARKVAEKIGGHAELCDVSDEASTVAALKGATAKFGVARILVNCAGIGGARRIVSKEGPMPLAHFEKVVKVNLTGTFNVTRLFAADLQTAEPLEAGERGVVIMTASVAAFEGQIGQAAYASSKGGIRALILPAAREFAQFGIRVVGIAPGIFRTPMMAGMRDDVQKSLAESIPFPKLLGTPAEYASLALQIVENRYLNGDLIRLDGAIRMAPR